MKTQAPLNRFNKKLKCLRIRKRYITLWIIIGTIVSVETAVRLFLKNEIWYDIQPAIYQVDPVLHYSYIPDTTFKVGKQTVYINKQGYLDYDFGKKCQDTFRIAIVGSCIVSGAVHKQEYHSFCPKLQQIFNKNNIPVRILNCGIDGDSRSMESFLSVKYKVIDFEPDIILLEYNLPLCAKLTTRKCYKEYHFDYPIEHPDAFEIGKKLAENIAPYKKTADILYHSYFVRTVVYCGKKISKALNPNHYQNRFIIHLQLHESHRYKDSRVWMESMLKKYSMDESIRMVSDLKQELQEKNIPFFLFQYGKHKEIIDIAEKNELPLISLGLSYSPKDRFPHDGTHLNRIGQQKTADKFYEIIREQGLIPERFIDPQEIKD